ncbi:MAG: DUF465 domain-containing protein [Rhizorhabdus sp.]|uniref:DUF465 domain-containing protein n=2 Tax=Rhizorhabdus sp. TaxID=1968843 RepID=UPI001B3DB3C1|nr:DUF465 domain-containing protein [Rhizorhabdus sp.]MBP8233571.1 DUF465 domain-containing protein [Rhizorhabdus sp.]
MTMSDRLQQHHKLLDDHILRETKRRFPDGDRLARLKRARLRVKDRLHFGAPR